MIARVKIFYRDPAIAKIVNFGKLVCFGTFIVNKGFDS